MVRTEKHRTTVDHDPNQENVGDLLGYVGATQR